MLLDVHRISSWQASIPAAVSLAWHCLSCLLQGDVWITLAQCLRFLTLACNEHHISSRKSVFVESRGRVQAYSPGQELSLLDLQEDRA